MTLCVVHSHYRPGGVRRVIETALPPLLQALGPTFTDVLLVGGEAPDPDWTRRLEAITRPRTPSLHIDPSLGYWTEQHSPDRTLRSRIRQTLEHAFDSARTPVTTVWAHNLALGRNPLLARELQRICAHREILLLLHHHDWWFDNRWARWPEMHRAGVRSLSHAARILLPDGPNIRHLAINSSDATALRRHFGTRAGWLPNPVGRDVGPSPAPPRLTRRWLREQCQVDGPTWIVPCRLLRRKNLAEALLLTRWLRPEAHLVTTGGVSSADERAYAEALGRAAQESGWPLRLGVLARADRRAPSVAQLLQASEAVLLTSMLEGFGLPFLEAAIAERPLLARRLSNISPDLTQFGLHFPQLYDEVRVSPDLFDWSAEVARQHRRFREWQQGIPAAARKWLGVPAVLATDGMPTPVPFSRLTLRAQLEILRVPASGSWCACAQYNPRIETWQAPAHARTLASSPWSRAAEHSLGTVAYARRLRTLLRVRDNASPARTPDAGTRAQVDLMQGKLASDNLYPMLWTPQP